MKTIHKPGVKGKKSVKLRNLLGQKKKRATNKIRDKGHVKPKSLLRG